MIRILFLTVSTAVFLSACTPMPGAISAASPGSGAYRITNDSQVQFRMLDSVNSLRQAQGLRKVRLNSALNAAAATHSRDMAVQTRPWHFGSDGSSPVGRAWRAGYRQTMLGELIAETFETELQTLTAWMESPGTRSVILDPQAEDMGFSWYQESNGKIWWTLIMGGGPTPIQPSPTPYAARLQG